MTDLIFMSKFMNYSAMKTTSIPGQPFCVSITWLYVAGCGVTDLYKEVIAMASLSIVVGHSYVAIHIDITSHY